MVHEHRDLVEAHERGRPLDRVHQPKRLVEQLPVGGLRLQRQQHLHELVELLAGLVEVEPQVIGHLVDGDVVRAVGV